MTDSIEHFFSTSTRGAKLVWCTAGKVLKVTQQARDANLKVIQDCKDLSIIRAMSGYCIIVTNEELMRGVDYRLKETQLLQDEDYDGIDLLIACPFSNSRAYQQGLARVGRYNEPCTRYILKDIE